MTAAVRSEIGEFEGVNFVPLGKWRLKGLAEAQEICELRPRERDGAGKVRDPVCGMEMMPIAAKLVIAGEEQAFCCETCVRAFFGVAGEVRELERDRGESRWPKRRLGDRQRIRRLDGGRSADGSGRASDARRAWPLA